MYRSILIALGCLLIVPLALAHGNEEHVMGTVTKVTTSSIIVQTTANKTVEVAVTDSTKFEKSGLPATLHDLAVGDRVVIHAAKSKDKLTAHTVKFAPARSSAVGGAPNQQREELYESHFRNSLAMRRLRFGQRAD